MPSLQDQSKKNSKLPRGPPVKEFEWFEMQTRLRKIIQQIIDPIQYEIVKNASQIDKLQKNNSSFHDRIQYIMRMTTNDPEVFEKGVFKKIQDKFESQQKTLTFLEEQVKNNTAFIDNKINLIDERMKQSNDMILQIEALKTSNRQNLKHQTQKFETVKSNIEQNVQKMSNAIEQNQKNSREKIQRLQKQIALITMKMENISKEFDIVKGYFGAQKSLNDDLITQGVKLKEENRQFQSKLGNLEKRIKELNKIKPFLQDIQTDYRKFMFKVDNIVPLINQAQINESLYRILPLKFHPRIAVYEFQKYVQLNEKVLSRHFQLEALSIEFNGELMIRQSQQRNTKLLTKLKRQYYKNNGVELDFISFEERERLLNDFDYPKLCEIVDELEELENEKNDSKKNHKLTQEDIVKLVQKEVDYEKQVLVQRIHSQIQDSKTYLKSSSEELHRVIQTVQDKIEKLSQNLQGQKKMNQLRDKRFLRSQSQMSDNLERFAEKVSILEDFDREVFAYLKKNLTETNNSNAVKQPENHEKMTLARINTKNSHKPSVYKEQNLKAKLGIILMNDSDQNNQSANQKLAPLSSSYLQECQTRLDALIRIISLFSQSNQQTKPSLSSKLKSSFSKLTRPSNSEIKHRSQSSFNPSRKDLHLSELNKSTQIHKTPQQNDVKGLLDIPEFKSRSTTRYCRQSHTSRLSIRKKPILNPSRAQFAPQDPSINFKNNEVRNSLSYFSELKKQNSRYLS